MLSNPKVKSVFNINIAGYEYTADITGFSLESKRLPPERTTFSKYTQGTAVEWTLRLDAIYTTEPEGLHNLLWNAAGYPNIPFIIRPYQDIDPNTKRFYSGALRIPHRPDLKFQAGKTSMFSIDLPVMGQPSRGDRPAGFLTEGYYDDY